MFAYCLNNPIVLIDSSGYRAVIPEFFADTSEEYVKWVRFLADVRNFDLDNTDPQKVYDATYFSSYKGTLVFRHADDYLSSWAIFNVIFLNHSNDQLSDRVMTLNHEYGHTLQEKEFGTAKYLVSIFLPSSIYNAFSRDSYILSINYYNMPWEYDADIRGNAGRVHASWAEAVASAYFLLWR